MHVTLLKAGSHNCFGHLDPAGSEADSDSVLEREVLLVYCGNFESMDGPVEVNEEHIDRFVAHQNSYLSRAKQALGGGIAMRDCPPLQLDHSTSAAMTVGRVVGQVRKGIFLDQETGQEKPAAYGRVRVLGRENCEKVIDGRWVHVSIGADLDTGKLNELSITPFPAAPNAAFLSKVKQGDSMNFLIKMRAALGKLFNLSEPDADAKAEKMKKRLMEQEKLSAEDAEKKLSEMDDENTKKLAADSESEPALAAATEDGAKLSKCTGCGKGGAQEGKELCPACEKAYENMSAPAAPVEAAAAPAPEALTGPARMSAEHKAKFIQLTKDMRKDTKEVRLQARKATVMTRLSALRASAKITPAEIKKIDMDKLAGANDATIDAVFKSYEDREPVIMTGVFGTAKAANLSAVVKQAKLKQLEEETRANMPSKRLSKSDKAKDVRLSSEESMTITTAPVRSEVSMQYEGSYGEICKMMDEGRNEDAKLGLKAFMDQMLNRNPEETGSTEPGKMQTHMSALATRFDKLQNQFEELVSLVGPNLGVETSEIEKGV